MYHLTRLPLAALAAALLVPAAASAATTDVSTTAQFTAAAAAAGSGDTIHVLPGVYAANIAVANPGVTIDADPGAILTNPTTQADNTPTLSFGGTGSPVDVVRGLYVLNASSVAAPAIAAGAPGLTLQRVLAFSVKGDAVSSAAGAGSANRTITIDSSMLFAQTAGAAAVRSTAANPLPTSPAGTTTVVGHHVTAVGDSTIVLDNSGANGAPAVMAGPVVVTPAAPSGNMTATFLDSILLGKRTATTNPGSLTSAANTATIDVSTRNAVADTAAPAKSVFVNPGQGNYHLRADRTGGGGFTAGESATDIDGDPIPTDHPSDLGADQFVNRAPTAVLAAVTGTPRQGQAVSFDASRSSDPEASSGGGIASYHWDFGDGQNATTTAPTTTHAYSARKAYSATVTVTDKQGATSGPSAPATFTVVDGTPPTITIAAPGDGKKVTLYRVTKRHGKKVRTRAAVTFAGAAVDDTALGQVQLALRLSKTTKGKCRWFDGRSKLVTAACTAPVILKPTVLGGGFRYTLPKKAKLPTGVYQLYGLAIDASGLSTGKIVTFRFR